jgi:hypothetical protein
LATGLDTKIAKQPAGQISRVDWSGKHDSRCGHQLTFGGVWGSSVDPRMANIATLRRQVRLVPPIPDVQVHVAGSTQMAGFCSTKSDPAPISFMKMNGTRWDVFAFYGKRNPCAPVVPRALLASDFTRTYGGSDHVTGQASFEAETHN